MKKYIVLIALLLSLFFIPVYAYAAGTCGHSGDGSGSTHCTGSSPWTADSCSDDDVNHCCTTCASAGETINIPAGSCTWSSQIAVTLELILDGAGEGTTVITNAYLTNYQAVLQFIVTDTATSIEISDMTFQSDQSNTYQYHISIRGDSEFKIHDMTFTTGRGYISRDIFIDYLGTYGVIYDCTFTDSAGESTGVRMKQTGDSDDGDASWAAATDLGSANAVYVEDCTWTWAGGSANHAITGVNGARYVFRYNSVTDGNIDVHGYCFNARSTRQFEIYNNTITCSTGYCTHPINIRGGTGVIFDNDIVDSGGIWTGTDSLQIKLTCYRVTRDACNGGCCPAGEGGEGYPCTDQPGMGQSQASEPIYVWGNEHKDPGVEATTVQVFDPYSGCGGASASTYIQASRDYYTAQKSGWPAAAYTYPHPLQGAGDSTPPTLSNLSPSASLPPGTTSTNMTCDSDEICNCKYHTSDVAYASMGNTFTATDTMSHSQTFTGLTDGSSTTYYIRCQDVNSNPMLTSDVITVAVDNLGVGFTAIGTTFE